MQNKSLISVIAAVIVLASVAFYIGLNYGKQTPHPRTPQNVVAADVVTETEAATEETATEETATDIEIAEAPETVEPAEDFSAAETVNEAATETTVTETVAAATAATDSADTDTPAAASQETTETPATAEDAVTAATEETSLLSAPASLQIDVERAMQDRVIGKADAPVTIEEFASMTCSHCANFHINILPDVKKELVETGRVKIIFRDFPLDFFAMKAAALARCAPEERYFDLVDLIFRNQDRWMKSEDPLKSLAQYGMLAGMDESRATACLQSETLQAALLTAMQEAQEKYEISSTPSFVFNKGQDKFSGTRDAKSFANTVDKLILGQ